MSSDKKTEWKQKLTESRANLKRLLTALSERQWQTPVYSEGQQWRVLDIAAHIADGEKGMSIQVHKIRQGQETVPAGFDLNRWNAGLKKRVGETTPDSVLETLDQVRNRTMKELETLQDEEWQLQGRHPSQGVITIEQYYETIAEHDQAHGHDIKQALGLS